MSLELRARIYNELSSLILIDPHTHIDPHQPASKTLADILGYHYYTELAHSAGMAKSQIEEPRLPPKEKVARLMANIGPIDNTIQYSWFVEMAQALLGFEGDSIGPDNWEELYDLAEGQMANPNWADHVLQKSNLEAVFLTNDFDDPLTGFDTDRYIPCLRTDDLVFNLAKVDVVERLERATGTSVTDAASLRDAIACLFTHFKANGARACAISLPPDFEPTKISVGRAQTAVDSLLRRGLGAAESDRRAVANFIFWTIAENCAQSRLPFDLMIGVNRGVYAGGVHQGRDLYDSRVSLIQYKALFNAFPRVVFPISVLASVTNQELVSYSWIFPNVVTNGHWWYSNTPTFIEHDLASRLEAVPRTKQIGYYSDMYKLEFALPKFNMYKRILAKVLAERFVVDRGWSETRAVAFGTQILRGNVEALFGFRGEPWTPSGEGPQEVADWSAPIAVKPVWGTSLESSRNQASFAADSPAVSPASPFGGMGGLAAMGAGAAAAATGAAALRAFHRIEAPPMPEENFDLEELEGDDLSDEQMIDFEPEDPAIQAGSGIDLDEAPSGPAAEQSLLAEQPFVAEAPFAAGKPFIDEPASDIPMEFSFDSGDLSEGSAKAKLKAAHDEQLKAAEIIDDDSIEDEIPPVAASLEAHDEFSLETAAPADESNMFAEFETVKEVEHDVSDGLAPPGMEATEPPVGFSLEPAIQAETADDAEMFAGIEERNETEPYVAEALALEPEALEAHVPFSLEPVSLDPNEPAEAIGEAVEFDELETDDKPTEFAEVTDDIELEELDLEDIEIEEEKAETPADELNFEDFVEKTDKDKKSKEN